VGLRNIPDHGHTDWRLGKRLSLPQGLRERFSGGSPFTVTWSSEPPPPSDYVIFELANSVSAGCSHRVPLCREEAQLAVFPEAFVPGYPRGIDFGTVVGRRTPEGRDQFRRYFDGAIIVPGPDVDRIATAAREHAIHLVVGVIERDGGTLYDTALFFSPKGYLGEHRKLMPTGAERLIWGFGDGSTLPVFDTSLGRLGAVICWENYMPMLRMTMYTKGIQIYCVPTSDSRETWLPTMRHIALEGRCFVLTTCQFLRRSDLPTDIPNQISDEPDAILLRGGAAIIGPLGAVMAGPCFDEEKILQAELDLDDIARGKYDFDVAGHYARPDVFQLSVNENPQRPVT
jgi:nitrilase